MREEKKSQEGGGGLLFSFPNPRLTPETLNPWTFAETREGGSAIEWRSQAGDAGRVVTAVVKRRCG